jgi:hypothetical protein
MESQVQDANKECCICSEIKVICSHCKFCPNAIICIDCAISLYKSDYYKRCPLCRQLQWQKKILPIHIVPIHNDNNIYDSEDEDESNNDVAMEDDTCRKFINDSKIAWALISLIGICFMLGYLTLNLMSDITQINGSIILIISLIIGIVELNAIVGCYYCWVKN